jgi:hypothetical protein
MGPKISYLPLSSNNIFKRKIVERKNIEQTWDILVNDGIEMPVVNGKPFIPNHIPNYDDEEPLGFSFFREGINKADYSNLSFPRTFFGRSEFQTVDFSNSDISESRMCWNDFINCNFTGANLLNCDMRASIFEFCTFDYAILKGVDLRHSTFKGCKFKQTDFDKAISSEEETYLSYKLNELQKKSIIWNKDPGSEPPGG